MSHEGNGKEGRKLEGFNGVKGQPWQEKGKCNEKSNQDVYLQKGQKMDKLQT